MPATGKPENGDGTPAAPADPVVVTVMVAEAALLPPTATVVGFIEQFESAGVPEHWSETFPANPPAGAIATAKLADCPADTLAEAGLAESAKSIPVPLNGTECGVPGALSAIISAAERAPPPVGVNIRLIVQFPPAGTGMLVEQVVPLTVISKSAASAPAITKFAIFRSEPPIFVRVTVWS